MSNYIDEDYYYKTFCGNLIPQQEFEKYATKASNEIRVRIMNRNISNYETEIKKATCSVADILYNQFLIKQKIQSIILGNEKIISSEKVGDYSRNFSNTSISELQKECDRTTDKINEELDQSLLFTGLLYTGITNV